MEIPNISTSDRFYGETSLPAFLYRLNVVEIAKIVG